MKKKILITLMFSISLIYAQNYHDCINSLWYFQNFGSTNNALANNSTTNSSGLTGFTSNPASLGLQQNSLIGISFKSNNATQDSRFQNTNGLQNSKYNNTNLIESNLDGISAILPVSVYRGSLVFGFSYSKNILYSDQADVTGDFNSENAPFTVDNTFDISGTMNIIKFGVAIEYQKNLFLGSSFNFYSGSQQQGYKYTDRDISDNFTYSTIDKNIEVEPDYSGFNFNLGLLYITKSFKFGANVSTPFTLHTIEKYTTLESWLYDDGEIDDDKFSDKIKYDIISPYSISSGIEYKVGNFSLLFDMKMQDWHKMTFDSKLKDYTYDDEGDLISTSSTDSRINSEIKNNLQSTLDYGFGITTTIFNNFKFNIGHRIIASPYFDSSAKIEKIHLTGFGLDTRIMNNLLLGLSYQFETGENTIDREYFEYSIEQKYNRSNFTLTTSLIF